MGALSWSGSLLVTGDDSNSSPADDIWLEKMKQGENGAKYSSIVPLCGLRSSFYCSGFQFVTGRKLIYKGHAQ